MVHSVLPFRDINLHASPAHYAFTSPSSPDAPTLVVERPTGDLRLNSGTLSGAKRISSIAGILGIIKLKLGMSILGRHFQFLSLLIRLFPNRQVHYCHYQSSAYGAVARPHGLQSRWY